MFLLMATVETDGMEIGTMGVPSSGIAFGESVWRSCRITGCLGWEPLVWVLTIVWV